MTSELNIKSFLSISDGIPEIAIYGYGDCYYKEVIESYPQTGSSCFPTLRSDRRKCYDWNALSNGGEIQNIQQGKMGIRQDCKAGLTNLVFENYLRIKKGVPIIPLLFIIQKNNEFISSPEEIASEEENIKIFTHSEIRRAYKLCYEYPNQEIRAAAQKTIRFVKVKKIKTLFASKLKGERIRAPWEHENWEKGWQRRKERSTKPKKPSGWILSLDQAIQNANLKNLSAPSIPTLIEK